MHETETSPRFIQLRTRHPEIKEYPIRFLPSVSVRYSGNIPMNAFYSFYSFNMLGGNFLQRLVVPVYPEHFTASRDYPGCMSGPAERPVYVATTRLHIQPIQYLAQHHRYVRSAHNPTSASAASSSA